jgi:hypothetical protein
MPMSSADGVSVAITPVRRAVKETGTNDFLGKKCRSERLRPGGA